MPGTQDPNRLHAQLASMMACEGSIDQTLEELIPEVSIHPGVTALLKGFQTLTKAHWRALEIRLKTIAGAGPVPKGTAGVLPVGTLNHAADFPASAALQMTHAMFNQAVTGYSVLHALSTRFLDSPWIADEGTSYHLAREHTQDYVRAIQQISGMLHDVVIWELDQKGLECQCICPSCGLGICLCALAGRSFLREAWAEAGPIAADEGVLVQLPKQNSAAANAGLRKGDVILAAGGQEIESYADLQSTVRNAEPGEGIRLTVRRNSDALEEVTVLRPQV